MTADHLRALIRDVPDYPKEGILFRDVTPLLLDPKALSDAAEAIAAPYRGQGIDRVLGALGDDHVVRPPDGPALRREVELELRVADPRAVQEDVA